MSPDKTTREVPHVPEATPFKFPEAYKWGSEKHAELLAERQELLSAAWSRGLLPFTDDDWLRLQSIRGILDAIEEHRELGESYG